MKTDGMPTLKTDTQQNFHLMFLVLVWVTTEQFVPCIGGKNNQRHFAFLNWTQNKFRKKKLECMTGKFFRVWCCKGWKITLHEWARKIKSGFDPNWKGNQVIKAKGSLDQKHSCLQKSQKKQKNRKSHPVSVIQFSVLDVSSRLFGSIARGKCKNQFYKGIPHWVSKWNYHTRTCYCQK